MKIIAKKGAKCPKENKPRQYIYDNAPVEVPNSIYYRRLVCDGSLVIVKEQSKRVHKRPQNAEKKNETPEKPDKGGSL